MIIYPVSLTDDAARDLDDLVDYIERNDSAPKADHVLQRIEKVLASLSRNPERGHCPQELSSVGVREYREIFFKPYRIIYRIMGKSVLVLLIVDGRRDMRTLLERRLLGSSAIIRRDAHRGTDPELP